ncbi:hypothetical protein HanHA300_Chr16g0604561 [Helianthus annuus]|nr:hypothetical protein HanHA300_Chr16g0604561 [Helianthus annuus]
MELNFYVHGCRGTSPSTWHTTLVHRYTWNLSLHQQRLKYVTYDYQGEAFEKTRWRNSTTTLDSCQQEN